jgi:hypothetical protein
MSENNQTKPIADWSSTANSYNEANNYLHSKQIFAICRKLHCIPIVFCVIGSLLPRIRSRSA